MKDLRLAIRGLMPLLVCFGFLSTLSLALALEPPQAQVWPESQPQLSVEKLRELKSFEVDSFHEVFESEPDTLDDDIVEYTQRALADDLWLPKASPAQGVIHLACDNDDCDLIRLSVTSGKRGPLIWESFIDNDDRHSDWKWFIFGGRNEAKAVAQDVVKTLRQAYYAWPTQEPPEDAQPLYRKPSPRHYLVGY